MRSLYTVATGETKRREVLGKSEELSICYHDLFDFPLTFSDLIKWNTSENLSLGYHKTLVNYQDGYYFLRGRRGLIYKRALRSRISAKKMEIAKKTSRVLSLIPAVLMVAVTGSLAMDNAGDEGDIDLLIITRKNLLWTTRMLSYLALKVFGFDLRKSGKNIQKDKLCLNMWMDETDLAWRKNDRNLYTAHEIAQVVPLMNKGATYEKFLRRNAWILKYWPNAVKIGKYEERNRKHVFKIPIFSLFEKIAFEVQYKYMKSKITREVVSPTRAIFHPQDLGKFVISRLAS